MSRPNSANKRITVTIEETDKFYYFEMFEKVLKCPICGHEYLVNKYCKQCWNKHKRKIENKEHIKETMGHITKDFKKYNCTCIFGSFYKFAGYWRNVKPYSTCKHYKHAINKINYMKKNNIDLKTNE